MNRITSLENFDRFNGKFRVIPTGLCGQKALEILNSIEGQLSDGYWENSRAMEKYWKNEFVLPMDDEEDAEIAIVVNANHGESVYEPYRWSASQNCMLKQWKYYLNGFYNWTDEKIKNWFADKIRQMVNVEAKDNHESGWWTDKVNDRELDYLGYKIKIKVSDCKLVYKKLKG
jgi:hypothetical protein